MSVCVFCNTHNVFTNGGFSLQKPYRETVDRVARDAEWEVPGVCDQCTKELVAAWAREYRRRNMPVITPDPTSPPTGSGTAYVEKMSDVA